MTSTQSNNLARQTSHPIPNFSDPNFDPADYLNDSLPPLNIASLQPNVSRAQGSIPLTELSNQVQSLLSQISAQNVLLSSTLSQLSDEILRSGGRLAYEVEVLRGETIGLSETLTEVLRDDIAKFVPETSATAITAVPAIHKIEPSYEGPKTTEEETTEEKQPTVTDPEYVANLRTLNQVRSRLEDVVQVFGDAMEWPLPPSEISFNTTFISVSGPEIGVEGGEQEERGQEIMKKLRVEISELLDSDGGGRAGLDAASRRVEALRTLATVWKGSAEEKARLRVVENLQRLVEERRRAQNQTGRNRSRSRPRSNDGTPAAGGLFRNLQRLKEEIYLD